jgi:hypothetical protein
MCRRIHERVTLLQRPLSIVAHEGAAVDQAHPSRSISGLDEETILKAHKAPVDLKTIDPCLAHVVDALLRIRNPRSPAPTESLSTESIMRMSTVTRSIRWSEYILIAILRRSRQSTKDWIFPLTTPLMNDRGKKRHCSGTTGAGISVSRASMQSTSTSVGHGCRERVPAPPARAHQVICDVGSGSRLYRR